MQQVKIRICEQFWTMDKKNRMLIAIDNKSDYVGENELFDYMYEWAMLKEIEEYEAQQGG